MIAPRKVLVNKVITVYQVHTYCLPGTELCFMVIGGANAVVLICVTKKQRPRMLRGLLRVAELVDGKARV